MHVKKDIGNMYKKWRFFAIFAIFKIKNILKLMIFAFLAKIGYFKKAHF
jgi:hypothetical protein